MSGSQQLLLSQTGGGGDAVTYVENVYNTYAYTGTGSTLSLTTGVNLSTKGGLVWNKGFSTSYHDLIDTIRGVTNAVFTNSSGAQQASPSGQGLASFNTDGVTFGSNYWTGMNDSSMSSVLWSFAKQAKFFDFLTYTGDGVFGRAVPHSLGSVPGFIAVKRTDAAGDWRVYHTSLGAGKFMYLNTASTNYSDTDMWANTTPTSTNFYLGNANSQNINGATYIAILFANNAGGFGLDGTESVVYCGSYSSTGQVNIGFEPQWIFTKSTTDTGSYTGDWRVFDCIRGIYVDLDDGQLFANTDGAQNFGSYGTAFSVNASGFNVESQGFYGTSQIYIAIRRDPMKVPTVATNVFSQVYYSGNGALNRAFTTGFRVDTNLVKGLSSGNAPCWGLRLTDGMQESNATGNPYYQLTDWINYISNNQLIYPTVYQYSNSSGIDYVSHSFLRAPKFHDNRTYVGNGSTQTVSHGMTIAPEFIIIKNRAISSSWPCYHSALGNTKAIDLNSTSASYTYNYWQNTTPTSSNFYLTSPTEINGSGNACQAIMFATCPGVSKVGSYSGTGSQITVDCGFTTGARWVMIKRSDSTGDWYVFCTALGMSAGSSPFYFLNSNGAYTTGVDYINTTSVGFIVKSGIPAALNASGGTYIFVAIA